MAEQLKNIFIITGASRGLGLAIARQLADEHAVLVLISRSAMKEQLKELKSRGAQVRALSADLLKVEKIEALSEKVFTKIDLRRAASITLINNAGMITPVGRVGELKSAEAIENLKLNFISPLILANCFLKLSGRFKGPRIIVNISSGAGKRPIEGWSLYCSAKASLEMFTQCVNKEQESSASGIKAVAVDPGALDTDMQAVIRRQKTKDFPLVDKFIEWHQTGVLKKPEAAAAEVVGLIRTSLGGAL
jgi:benzil reductase ((S)-benzoin forming)